MPKKTLYRTIVFAVLVVIVLGLAWRNSANGQQNSTEPETRASQLLTEMVRRLETRDMRTSYRFVGRVEDTRASAEMLLAGPQHYIEIFHNSFEILTLNSIDDALRAYLLRRIESAIAIGDLVYSLNVNGRNINAVISRDGSRSGGLFLMLSRIYMGNFEDDIVTEEECKEKVLSRDIFNRTAEKVSACCRATCLDGSVQNCEVEEMGNHGVFGYIDLNPSSRVKGSMCRGSVRYTWGVRFRLPYIDFDIPGRGGNGTLIVAVECGG